MSDTVDDGETDIAVARCELEATDEELAPFQFAERIVAGVHPVRFFRDQLS